SERAQMLAGELVAQNVDLIITFGDPAIRAVQGATQAIPIVAMTDDMVGSGLVASLARPGGNTTGVSILASELDVKRLEILHEFIPQARRIALLIDTTTISTGSQLSKAARELGVELVPFDAQSPDEVSRMLDDIAAAKVDAVNVLASPLLNLALRIGVLLTGAADDPQALARVGAFLQGLQELGWTDGRNVRIEYRWGSADAERIHKSAAELVALAPDVIVVSGNSGMV